MKLIHVTDDAPGFSRKRNREGFSYFDHTGRKLTAARELERITSLVIPPAWTGVWICVKANGHLQATGRDARKRKQYRYHPLWSARSNIRKFERLLAFGEALPKLRRKVAQDLKRPGISREKVLATVVRLLDQTLIRVGNDEYMRDNESFGLTTMQDSHARIRGVTLNFRFKGKSGVAHDVTITNPLLARIVKRCQDLPGQRLFAYKTDEGKVKTISSSDVNSYLRETTGQDFTAKDFRTWHGSVLAGQYLSKFPESERVTQRRKKIVEAIKYVAELLRNRPATSKKYYIHPELLSLYERGALHAAWNTSVQSKKGYTLDELRLMHLLKRQDSGNRKKTPRKHK